MLENATIFDASLFRYYIILALSWFYKAWHYK